MYTYYLLAFFNNYLAQKVLSVSFQNGDANTIQAKDQLEDILI